MKFRIIEGGEGEDKAQCLEGNCPNCNQGPYTIILLSERLIRNSVAKKNMKCLCCMQEFSATISTIDKGNV